MSTATRPSRSELDGATSLKPTAAAGPSSPPHRAGAAPLLSVSVVVVCKDEPKVAETLTALEQQLTAEAGLSVRAGSEIVVVDASAGRLDWARAGHPMVHWVDFTAPPGAGVTIPHQRNAGITASSGDVVVFVDSGCLPCEGWLARLLAPISRGDELVVSGRATGAHNTFERPVAKRSVCYLEEAATINLAVHRSVFEVVGTFDENFAYGSDVDFTWRVVEAGIRIRYEPLASVEHDWGSFRRRMRRARQYGAARARLYRKHPGRVLRALWDDPVPFVYPLWLLGLPLAMKRRAYLWLLAAPLWRARKHDSPIEIVLSHLVQGIGSLSEATAWLVATRASRGR